MCPILHFLTIILPFLTIFFITFLTNSKTEKTLHLQNTALAHLIFHLYHEGTTIFVRLNVKFMVHIYSYLSYYIINYESVFLKIFTS